MRRTAALVALLLLLGAAAATAQPAAWPATVERVELRRLAGAWFEVATSGEWSHRRCVADTRFEWQTRDARTLDVRSACTTAAGEETRRGRLRAPAPTAPQPGRLDISFAPALLRPLPAAWSDYWVIGMDAAEGRWLVVGDRWRERLSVLSRTASLDEAALAQAIAAARTQGYNVDALVAVPHARALPASR